MLVDVTRGIVETPIMKRKFCTFDAAHKVGYGVSCMPTIVSFFCIYFVQLTAFRFITHYDCGHQLKLPFLQVLLQHT